MGPALARRRPLLRHQRLRERPGPRAVDLARLGRAGLQLRHALRPVPGRADRRRPPAQCHAGSVDRHRLPPQQHDQRRRGHRARAVPHGGDVRSPRLHWQGGARADHPVRPVSFPQVRPNLPHRVLRAVLLPQQHLRSPVVDLFPRATAATRRFEKTGTGPAGELEGRPSQLVTGSRHVGTEPSRATPTLGACRLLRTGEHQWPESSHAGTGPLDPDERAHQW